MAFGWADYLVCGLMLVISSSIGIYYRFTGGQQKSNKKSPDKRLSTNLQLMQQLMVTQNYITFLLNFGETFGMDLLTGKKEFLLANNDANMFAVAFSLMATFMSSITILGVSSEIYTFGFQFVAINLSYGLFTPIASHLYLPVFYNLKTTSAYEYLERRFGIITRLVASAAFTSQMILYMGIVVYAPALALEAVTGVKNEYAILIMGTVCTFYAGLGGMKAILLADVFQALLMFAAVYSIIVTALLRPGLTEIWNIAKNNGRLDTLNFSLDPTERHTWWSLIIGGGFTFLTLYAVNQAQVQRYLSVKNLKTAQKSLYLNWPILSLLSLSTSFAGLCIFSKYYNCDPLLTKRISSNDQLMPRYVLDTTNNIPGISGLFVAGIFSGSLSTVSSALNSLSAVTVEDYIKPAFKRIVGHGLEESKAIICSKVVILVFGCCCVAVAFIAQFLGGLLQAALTIFGVVGGPLLGTFTLGMFIPMANEMGSLPGLIFGLCIGFWLGFGTPKPFPPVLDTWSDVNSCKEYKDIDENFTFLNHTRSEHPPSDEYFYLYRLSYQWYSVISFLATILIGIFCSWVGNKIKHKEQQYHPDLFTPPLAKYLRKKISKNEVNAVQNSELTSNEISLNKRT